MVVLAPAVKVKSLVFWSVAVPSKTAFTYLIYKKDLFWQFIVISKTKSKIMDLKKILQVLGIIALSLFVIQLILGLVLSFAIGGFIFNAVDKIEDKIEIIDLSDVKVDIINDEDSIHINSNSQKENNSKEKVLIIMGNDTIVNIQKNKKWIMDY